MTKNTTTSYLMLRRGGEGKTKGWQKRREGGGGQDKEIVMRSALRSMIAIFPLQIARGKMPLWRKKSSALALNYLSAPPLPPPPPHCVHTPPFHPPLRVGTIDAARSGKQELLPQQKQKLKKYKKNAKKKQNKRESLWHCGTLRRAAWFLSYFIPSLLLSFSFPLAVATQE